MRCFTVTPAGSHDGICTTAAVVDSAILVGAERVPVSANLLGGPRIDRASLVRDHTGAVRLTRERRDDRRRRRHDALVYVVGTAGFPVDCPLAASVLTVPVRRGLLRRRHDTPPGECPSCTARLVAGRHPRLALHPGERGGVVTVAAGPDAALCVLRPGARLDGPNGPICWDGETLAAGVAEAAHA